MLRAVAVRPGEVRWGLLKTLDLFRNQHMNAGLPGAALELRTSCPETWGQGDVDVAPYDVVERWG